MKRWFFILLLLAFPAQADESYGDVGRWTLSVNLPEGEGPFPLLIFLPGCDGWGSYIERAADRHRANLSDWAFARLDILAPRGIASVCADDDGLGRMRWLGQEDATHAALLLAKDPRFDAGQIVFMGQSMGGSIALDIASASRRKLTKVEEVFAAVVAYYPWCYDNYGLSSDVDFDTPTLILGGANDEWTPVSRCQKMTLADKDLPFHIEVFPDSYHSFDLDDLEYYEMQGVSGIEVVAGNREQAQASREFYRQWLSSLLGP